MSYLVGIDLGSTSLKTMIYDLSGRAVAKASRPTQVFNPHPEHPDWAVWKPEQIWGGVTEALQEAIGRLDDPKKIRAVAVTGMGMDGVPVDKAGNWLYPFISWHCPRTVPQHEWWLQNIGAEKQFAISGNPVWAINSALRLLWMREHEPAILDKTDKWLLIEDFVNFMLCGVRATDYSMASNTLLFDQRTQAYSDELLKLSGINRNLLCDPQPSGTVLGEVHTKAATTTGLPVGTPVVLGGHDFLCGMLPVGAFKPGVVLDIMGTWDIVTVALEKPVLTPEVQRMGWWIDSHVALGMHAAMGTAVASDMLEWFRREYGQPEKQQSAAGDRTDWDYLMAAAAASPAGARGVMFLPHMSGSTIPAADPKSKGAFIGLRNLATKGDMIRAIIEGLNYQFLEILSGLEAAVGVTPHKLVMGGGGTSNTFWMQNRADMAGQSIEAPGVEEATPLGAAILAGIGVGLYKNEEEAYLQVCRPGRIYEPNLERTAFYAERFDLFRKIYPALKDISAQIKCAGSS